MPLPNNNLDIGPNDDANKQRRLFYYDQIVASGLFPPELVNLKNVDVEKVYWRLVNEGLIAVGGKTAVADIIGSGTAGRSLLSSSTATDAKTVLSLQNVNNTSDANKPVSTAQAAAYGIFGYVLANFTSQKIAGVDSVHGEKLSIFYSPDGKTVHGGGGNPVYTDPNTNNSLRDPSLIKLGARWYETHTVNNGINKSFAILGGNSLTNLSQIALIDTSALPDHSRTWAPEFIVDPAEPTRPYIFFSKINLAGTAGVQYWIQATNDALTAWTLPTLMTWTAVPAHYIDGVFIKVGTVWYMFYSIGNDICRATSTSLTGTYTTDKTGNWAGWGTGIEGPALVIDPVSGKYRMYFDRFVAGTGYAWSESTDLTTWTAPVGLEVAPGTLPPGGLIRHGTFLPIPDQASYLMVKAAVDQEITQPYTTFSGSYSQTASATVTNVGTPTRQATESNNDFVVSADGTGKFTFRETGTYDIYGSYKVTGATGVSRTFAELAGADGVVTYARTSGAAEDVFQLLVPSFKAVAGQQVTVRTFTQYTSAGGATINGTTRFTKLSRG